jgi:hypothetical protein
MTPAKPWLTSIGSVVLAVLASQHHLLHMAVLTLGAGAAGMSVLTMAPALRRGMLGLALLVAGVTAYQLWRRDHSLGMRLLHGASIGLTLALVAWTVLQVGM